MQQGGLISASKYAATLVLDVAPCTVEVQRESISRFAGLKPSALANAGLIFIACSAEALRVFVMLRPAAKLAVSPCAKGVQGNSVSKIATF